MTKRACLLLSVPLAAATTAACVAREIPRLEYGGIQRVEYREVQRVLDAKCVSCHAGSDAARGLRLDSWDGVVAGSRHGEAVIPFDADNSLLIEITTKLVDGPHPMELDGDALREGDVALLSTWVAEGARSGGGKVPHSEAEQLLYVANQGSASVSVIDMETNMVTRTVDLQALGFSPGSLPHHIAVEPDGSFWYVSLIAANRVLKFNRNNELVGQAELERPGLLALDPASDRLYVGRSMAAVNPPQSIGIVNRSDMTFEEMGVFFGRPHALAAGPGGDHVFVSSLSVNQVATLWPEEEDIELSTLVADRPHVFVQFAISPTEPLMVGTTEITSKVFVFDLEQVPNLMPFDTIDVGAAPWHPVFTPDGRWVYVGNNWANSVTVIDMQDRRVAKVIEGPGLAQPHGSAVSPDGRYAYIANRNLEMPQGHTKFTHRYVPRYDLGDNATVGTVIVIDTESQEIVKIIETGEYSSGLGTAAIRR